MRAMVDSRDAQIEALDDIATREGVSRAALIRQAIDLFLTANQVAWLNETLELWGHGEIDGLASQRRLRDEW